MPNLAQGLSLKPMLAPSLVQAPLYPLMQLACFRSAFDPAQVIPSGD
jgi:hypothetical protein